MRPGTRSFKGIAAARSFRESRRMRTTIIEYHLNDNADLGYILIAIHDQLLWACTHRAAGIHLEPGSSASPALIIEKRAQKVKTGLFGAGLSLSASEWRYSIGFWLNGEAHFGGVSIRDSLARRKFFGHS